MIKKEYFENGQLRFEYGFENGKKHGIYKEYFENNKVRVETNYKNGERDGLYKEYDKEGNLKSEINYKGNKKYGLCRYYNEDGKISREENYKNGEKCGLCKKYYKDGKINREENYKNGKLDGLQRVYYENSQLKYENNYKNGGEDGICKSYYENGQLKSEDKFKNGYFDGLQKSYYENGQLKNERDFKDGEWHGIHRRYYENGNLELESNYKDGRKDGLYKKYYENGQLKFENYRKDGKKCFGKNLEYLKKNNQEIVKISYHIYENENNEIVYQEDYQNNTLNLIIRKNYLVLNGERICLSQKMRNNIKELQSINDNIKLKVNGNFIKLDKGYYKNICSYEGIIGKIEVSNKEIFFEREFIREGKLNGLKVLYKKNKGIKEYVNVELYENDIKIEDNIEDRKRLLTSYLMSREEKEEWINIPFKVDSNYCSTDIRRNKTKLEENNITDNFKEKNNKLFYIIIPIILFLLLAIFLLYKFKYQNNHYQQNSIENTASYFQPQQEEEKESVAENSNVNKYIPTVEDARYVNYKTYYNDDFDYSIDYPDDEYFQISKTYEDGIRLKNNNGEVIISLTSNWNPNGESLQQAYDKAVKERPNAAYKFLGKTFFTITYEDNGLLIFRKTMYDKANDKYVYLYVSFPPEYKDYMTPIVERMANSMKKSTVISTTDNNVYIESEVERKFGRVVKDKYVGGSFIEFLRDANQNEYYYLREQFWEILDTMYITQDNKTYYYLNDIIDKLERKADWDHEATTVFLEVKGNKLYYTIGFPKGYNANTPSWIQFEIFERKFKDGIGLRTAHVSCAINGVEYKDWEAIDAIYR